MFQTAIDNPGFLVVLACGCGNPGATRPWQHVLEPLSGYLALAARLLQADGGRWADAWNFGPGETGVIMVETLARALVSAWGKGEVR